MFFYTKLRDAVGVKSPKPLAIWTDGADGTDENKCVEYFALMMEDMTADGTMEVHDISGLDPPRIRDRLLETLRAPAQPSRLKA